MGSHFRTSAGVGLHVEADGPSDAPVTLVLSHGWTLDTRSWEPVARALTRPDRPRPGPAIRVLRYDHRGHGRSQSVARAEMTIDALADDLADLIAEHVPSGPVVLAGHSMGGMTAMALAERHPELVRQRVAGVALVSTASGGLADSTLGLSVRMLGLVRKGEARLAASERFDRRPVLSRRARPLEPAVRWLLIGRGADAGARAASARCVADCRPSTMVGFRPTLDAHERDEALEVFAGIPVEVMVGTRDKLTPVAASKRIVANASSARLTVYGGAGHMLPLERVHGVADQLSELCARVAGDPGVSAPRPAGREPAGIRPAHAMPGST
ncbi:MAG TPA: alpha/beta hydrolase [Pseudonocardia sp.]|jgi:pimeloyl-ACP methyl ester carboxylesterase|nr:alpha/beta hydrolase [Pseudonocardia sp.]